MEYLKRAALVVTIGAVSGCGGGGSSSPAATPVVAAVTSFPVESAIVADFAASSSYSATASDTAGNSYALSFSGAPVADTTVPALSSKTLKVFTNAILLKKNGVTASTGSSAVYYTLNPLFIYGSTDSQGDIVKVTQQTQLPATSTVGTQGALYSGTQYVGGSSFNTHAQTATWSLEADSASTAWLCVNVQTATLSGSPTVESDCYRINSTGSISGFKADITTSGVTLKFR